MTRIKMPTWIRDELSALIEKQMNVARMLAVRLTDPDARDLRPVKGRVKATEIVAAIVALDELCERLNGLADGTAAFAKDPDDYRRAVAFAMYCDRSFKYRTPRAAKS